MTLKVLDPGHACVLLLSQFNGTLDLEYTCNIQTLEVVGKHLISTTSNNTTYYFALVRYHSRAKVLPTFEPWSYIGQKTTIYLGRYTRVFRYTPVAKGRYISW